MGKKVSIKGWEKIQCDKWLLETRMNEAVSVLNKIYLATVYSGLSLNTHKHVVASIIKPSGGNACM